MCDITDRRMDIVVEKVLDILISYSTISLYQIMANTSNIMCGTSFLVIG
jgi:hypothetical protein